jgi:hypothetical protein
MLRASSSSLAHFRVSLSSEGARRQYEAMLDWKKDDRWKRSPFGKVVALGRASYSAECRLAGYLRGEAWARTNYTAPP